MPQSPLARVRLRGARCAASVRLPPPVECRVIPLKPKYGLNGAPTFCCRFIGNSRSQRHGSFHTHSLYQQQRLGAPFKPYFGLSGITRHSPVEIVGRSSTTARLSSPSLRGQCVTERKPPQLDKRLVARRPDTKRLHPRDGEITRGFHLPHRFPALGQVKRHLE
jgi:hypothetical protein